MDPVVDQDEDQQGYRWETEYEKTWEAIKETDEGLLAPNVEEMLLRARRKRLLERKNLRLGMMRHLYLVLDLSESMAQQDLRPTRLKCTLKIIELFLNEFFDQNPISQVGIITTKNKRSEKIVELSANSNSHAVAIKRLSDALCVGEPSLQNAVTLAESTLKHLPKHTSKEIVILFGSLTTCDPTDIKTTMDSLKENTIRVSIVGLSAELHVCRELARKTGGEYNVAIDETHLKDLLFVHLNPPPTLVGTDSSLIRMGFPQYVVAHGNESQAPAMCTCHLDDPAGPNFSSEGYYCPQCGSKYCDIPVECKICGLTLVSAAHLARSYHHLFPVDNFLEISELPENKDCFSCRERLTDVKQVSQCAKCSSLFCIDCDTFIHETMHVCPGCASRPS